jgi:acyl carrier protein
MQQHDGTFDADPRVIHILDILAKEAAIARANLRPDATLEALGVGSLDLTMAVFQLETVLDINIPAIAERAGAEFGTVGELVSHVIAAMDKAEAEKAANGQAERRKEPDSRQQASEVLPE